MKDTPTPFLSLKISGSEFYEILRPLGYAQTNVILVCFAVNMPESYERIRSMWVAEARHYCPDAPLVVVGTKTDLRGRSNSQLITPKRNVLAKLLLINLS